MSAQQPATKHGTEQAAHQQPDQAAEGAVPEFGQGELRIAQHFDPCGLLPAAHDQRIAALGAQVDQFDEPARYAFGRGSGSALHHDLLVFDVDHADAGEIAAVEDRTDHQFNHRRVVDLCGQRQPQRGGGILGVGAQLAEHLLARAFQADKKTATEGHQQKQADGQEQLFE
ncbi:hypothetical protein D3C84_378630 [compost metagenome]